MKNIVWVRIDDRLIHGQVMTQWIQHCQANEVVIVDDGVAKDNFIKMIMKSSVPSKISLKIFSVQEAIPYLLGEQDNRKILILVKVPSVLVTLKTAGVQFDFVNIGGIGAKAGRKSLYKNISTSQEENEDIVKLIEMGTRVYFRVVVSDAEEDASSYVK